MDGRVCYICLKSYVILCLGATPLHLAALNGYVDMVNYLVAVAGVDPELRDKDGELPLHFAVTEGQLDVIDYFVKRNMHFDVKMEDGM